MSKKSVEEVLDALQNFIEEQYAEEADVDVEGLTAENALLSADLEQAEDDLTRIRSQRKNLRALITELVKVIDGLPKTSQRYATFGKFADQARALVGTTADKGMKFI